MAKRIHGRKKVLHFVEKSRVYYLVRSVWIALRIVFVGFGHETPSERTVAPDHDGFVKLAGDDDSKWCLCMRMSAQCCAPPRLKPLAKSFSLPFWTHCSKIVFLCPESYGALLSK
jgi:hypothetical protein